MIKFLLDTSVLLAAFDTIHIHHAASLPLFERCTQENSCCAAHNLAEFYCNSTRMPLGRKVPPLAARAQILTITSRLATVALTADEYTREMVRWGERGILGANIYDALIASCALKAGVKTIYTWNLDDFRRLGPEIAALARTP